MFSLTRSTPKASVQALKSALPLLRIQQKQPLATSAIRRSDVPPPNHPPSAKAAGRESPLSSDDQSSASNKDQSAQSSGDDHPAKQPDPQAPSDRSTGIGNVKAVKGGEEGLGQRTDRQ